MNGRTNTSGITVNNGISIPLEAPTNLLLSAGDQTVSMTWTDPIDKYTETFNELVSQWSYDTVVRKEGSVPSSPQDGTVVTKITSKNQHQNSPFTDTGMENDKRWYYSVYSWNQFGTQSEPISGSEIPTERVTLEYFNDITLSNRLYCLGSTATHLIAGCSSEDSYFSEFTAYDENLTKTTVPIEDDPYWFSRAHSSARVGNNIVFDMMYNSTRYKWYDVWIDPNLIIHHSGKEFTSNSFPGDGQGLSSVNNKVGYHMILTYKKYNDSGVVFTAAHRIDENMLWSDISIPSYRCTQQLSVLSSDKYAAFTGFYTHDPSAGHSFHRADPYFLFYNENGVRNDKSITDLSGSHTGTTTCGDSMIFYKLVYSEDFVSSNVVYRIDSNLVDSKIGGPSRQVTTVNNAQTIGLGFIPTVEGDINSNMIYPTTIDKNFMYRDRPEMFNEGSISGYIFNHAACRHGIYFILPYTPYGQSVPHLVVVKNGHESDLEEV